MNRASTVSILVALISVSALGVASSTLETTLTTDPEDEIDPNWDRLPIDEGDAATIRAEIEGARDADIEGGGEAESGQRGTTEPSEATGQRANGGDGSGNGLGLIGDESTLIGRLLALLASLIPIVALVALSALVYRYRETVRSLLDLRIPESTAEPASNGTGRNGWLETAPSNVVDRAWVALVRQVNPDRPGTMTTGEFRALAGERGLDATAVDSIATAFERVHYGDVPIAEEASRARGGLRRLEEGSE